jgi:hypothetical protein
MLSKNTCTASKHSSGWVQGHEKSWMNFEEAGYAWKRQDFPCARNDQTLKSDMSPLSARAVRGLPGGVFNGGEIPGHPGDLFGTGGKENVLLMDSGVPTPLYP